MYLLALDCCDDVDEVVFVGDDRDASMLSIVNREVIGVVAIVVLLLLLVWVVCGAVVARNCRPIILLAADCRCN